MRHECLRCTRTAVDAGPPTHVDADTVAALPITGLLDLCTVRLGAWATSNHYTGSTLPDHHAIHNPMTTTVTVFVGDTPWWQLPLSIALWLRDTLVAQHGMVAESTCATTLFCWCLRWWERAHGDTSPPSDEPLPWRLSFPPQQATCYLTSGTQATNILCTPCTEPSAYAPTSPRYPPRPSSIPPAPAAATPPAGGAATAGPFTPHAHDDAVHGVTYHSLRDPVDWMGNTNPTTHRAPSADPNLTSPVRWYRHLATNIATCITRLDTTIHHWTPAARSPWPSHSYHPVPCFDITVARVLEEQQAPPGTISHTAPLLTYRPPPTVNHFNAAAWDQALEGHPHHHAVMTAVTFGCPLLLNPQRQEQWAGAAFQHPHMQEDEERQVDAFMAKERAAGRVVPATDYHIPHPSSLWVAPFALAPKAGGAPGEIRVCHDLSRTPPDGTTSLNEDMDLTAISPVGLLQWATVVQRVRHAIATNPHLQLHGWKEDLQFWFRQMSLRQRDLGAFVQEWQGELLVHLVLTFGSRVAVHITSVLLNALGDALQAHEDLTVGFFVDDSAGVQPATDAATAVLTFISWCTWLGLRRHPSKRTGPCTALPILGIHLDLATGTASLTDAKRATLRDTCDAILTARGGKVTVATLQHLAGLCIFASGITPWGRSHTAPIWQLAGGMDNPNTYHQRTLNPEVIHCVQWWHDLAVHGPPPTTPLDIGANPARGLVRVVRARTDAAKGPGCGFGGLLFQHPGHYVEGVWEPHETQFSINVLELAAIVFLIGSTAHLLTASVCVLESDNTTCVFCIRLQSPLSPTLRFLCHLLSCIQEFYRFQLRVHYLVGPRNRACDYLSRRHHQLQDHRPAPPSILSNPGWAWSQVPVPPVLRQLGDSAAEQLWRTASPVASAEPRPPRDLSTWLRTCLLGIQAACPPTFSSYAEAPPTPFIGYHPAWAASLSPEVVNALPPTQPPPASTTPTSPVTSPGHRARV